MSALRTIRPTRLVALRSPAPMFTRHFTPPDSRSEGATATSEGFSKREQAEEGQYIKKRELEKLKAAQAKLAEAQAEVDKQQKKVDEAGKK